MTGLEYIQQKREEVYRSIQAWKIGASELKKSDEKVLKKTLDFLSADRETIDELIKAKHKDSKNLHPTEEFRRVLAVMSDSLRDDLNVYTNNTYQNIVQKSGLSILESGDIHAGCVRVDDFDEQLDGYAIFINLGTYYALQLLAKTIIIENFTNEFAEYQRQATEFIDLATDIYIAQDSNTTQKIFFDEYPAAVQSEASAAQSAVVVKVMQFIVLHELGHIVNGDLEIMGFHKRFMNANHKTVMNLPDDVSIEASHQAEFAADMFAFNALFNYESPAISKWSSFYPVFYFLVWLDAIEKKFGHVLSNLHPNALERARRMQNALLEITHNDDLGYGEELDKVVAYFAEWSRT